MHMFCYPHQIHNSTSFHIAEKMVQSMDLDVWYQSFELWPFMRCLYDPWWGKTGESCACSFGKPVEFLHSSNQDICCSAVWIYVNANPYALVDSTIHALSLFRFVKRRNTAHSSTFLIVHRLLRRNFVWQYTIGISSGKYFIFDWLLLCLFSRSESLHPMRFRCLKYSFFCWRGTPKTRRKSRKAQQNLFYDPRAFG